MRFVHIMLLALGSVVLLAQTKPQTHLIVRKNGQYTEKYQALDSDTSVRHGTYRLIYKNHDIEKGTFDHNRKVGSWTYYNFSHEIEFIYDYATSLPHQIIQHAGAEYGDNTFPPMFLGSPVRLYHFITYYTYYPVKESQNKVDCPVILVLEIDEDGCLSGYRIDNDTKPEFRRVVLQAASKIPKEWRWVPGQRNGRRVKGDYCITIVFESVED